jgi:hypothetical protein
MDGIRSVSWEAPEHSHPDKGGDWYFALLVLTIAVVIAAVVFDNFLFAILAALSGASIAIAASQPPRIIEYAVSAKGVRVDTTFYTYNELQSYSIDDEDERGPQLLLLGKKAFMPMIVMPIPEEYIDEIESLLEVRLPEAFLEEPLLNRLLALVGM